MKKKKPHEGHKPITKTEKVNYIINREKHELIKLDGFDEYCLGIVHQTTGKPVLCYDLTAILSDGIGSGKDMHDMLKICDLTNNGKIPLYKTPVFLEKI